MSLVKRNAFIAAGIGLYLINAICPLNSIAESIAANTQEPRPSISASQSATDFGSTAALQYFMMEEPGKANLAAPVQTSSSTQSPSNSLDGSTFDPLQLPGIADPAETSESYVIEGDKGEAFTIKVTRETSSGYASLFINEQEVMKFRSSYDVLDPYDRAQLVAQRLYTHLNNALDAKGPKALSIRPGQEDGHYVLKVGNDVLAMIDQEAAAANGNSEKAQAIVWTNQIREALGIKAYKEPLASMAAIISSPGTSKKYKLPLSTAYFQGTGKLQSGQASWYGPGFHGRRSSDGSRFDMNQMTAAHRYLPFGTVLKVKNNRNGKQCLVQITDRGPYAHNRIIDLSKAAAGSLGMLSSGTASVTIEVLSPGKPKPAVEQADSSLIGSAPKADALKN